jgi:hypothetical protein
LEREGNQRGVFASTDRNYDELMAFAGLVSHWRAHPEYAYAALYAKAGGRSAQISVRIGMSLILSPKAFQRIVLPWGWSLLMKTICARAFSRP